MNAKTSVFVTCVKAIIYLLLYDLHDCTKDVKIRSECLSIVLVMLPVSKYLPTLESRIIGGIGIIGGLNIVIIINNRGGWNNRGGGGVDGVEKIL